MTHNDKRCEITTRAGHQCKRRATHTYDDWETCWQHHKARPNKALTKLTLSMFLPEDPSVLLYPAVPTDKDRVFRYLSAWFR